MRVIKDVAMRIGAGSTPLRGNPAYWDPPETMWLKSEQLGNFIIYETKESVSSEAVHANNLRIWPKNTVSVAMYGEGKTRGSASILGNPMATNQAICNIEVDEQKANYEFLYYWLVFNYFQLRQLSSGVRNNLNADDIRGFPFPNFKISSQISISRVLSSIDKKMLVNNQINDNLVDSLAIVA